MALTKKESVEAQFLFALAKQKPAEHRKVIENEQTVTQARLLRQ